MAAVAFFGKQHLLFFVKSPLSSIFATFPILYVWEVAAAFLHLFLSMFVKQLLLFLPNLPSPLLSFVLPMMKLSKSIHYMEYELMIKNL